MYIVRGNYTAANGTKVCAFARETRNFHLMCDSIDELIYNRAKANSATIGCPAKAHRKQSVAETFARDMERNGYTNVTIIEVQDSELIAGYVNGMNYLSF